MSKNSGEEPVGGEVAKAKAASQAHARAIMDTKKLYGPFDKDDPERNEQMQLEAIRWAYGHRLRAIG